MLRHSAKQQMNVEATQTFSQQTAEYYNQLAEYYDLIYGDHVQASKQLVERASQIVLEKGKVPSKVLDVGCGNGWDIAHLGELGWNCSFYGCDLSLTMLSKARQIHDDLGVKSTLWEGDILYDNFGFGDDDLTAQFDLIIFRGNSLGHLNYEEYLTAFTNVFKMLKNGGMFLYDFRDGYKLFELNQAVEILNSQGRDETGYHLAAYFQDHGSNVRELYHLLAVLVSWNDPTQLPVTRSFPIAAHYVLPELTEKNVRDAGFASQEEITDRVGESLPTLRTFIACKS